MTDHELHVWRIPLDQTAEVVADARLLLSSDERIRADRFFAEGRRARFTIGRAALRSVLGAYLSEDPVSLKFRTNPHGKPMLDGLEFNLSHSADRAVLALSRTRQVGVDVERIRPMTEFERIAGRFFSVPERSALASIPTEKKTDAFFRIWTRKEAYIKAIGVGLSIALDSFDVPGGAEMIEEHVAVTDRDGEDARWFVRDIGVDDGYVAAIVSEGSGWDVRRFDFDRFSRHL